MIYGEKSETLELKRSTGETKEALNDISAILNKYGRGELYFGIRNDGEIIGQQYIEHFGTGIKRIDVACKEADIKYEFRREKLGFTVVFYRPKKPHP